MNRKQCLEESIKCVCTDRKEQYGSAEDSFKAIADFFQVYINHRCLKDGKVKITAQDASNLLILFKVARMTTGIVHKDDTYIDIAGYAACSCELGESKEPTKEELIDMYGVDKKTNEPMLCSEIGGCRKCLFAESDCYDSMREWVEDHFTDAGKMVDSKNNKKITVLNLNKIAIHCDTKEKAEKLRKIIKIPKRFVEYWNDYKQDTCYSFEIKLSDALFAKKDEYEKIGYTILEFDDFDWSEYGEEK